MQQDGSPHIAIESAIPLSQETDILLDGTLLREATRRRLRSWIVLGPIIFLIVAGLMLFVMPQSYTASASISVQQGMTNSSPLAILTGSGGGNKKYIGILHSRRLAEIIEDKFHLQQFYHLKMKRQAIDLLVDSVKPEDSAAEGLLFVRVTLNGPPRLMPDPKHRSQQAKRLAADIANEYVTQLRQYYADNDNDRDSVLLKAADQELQRAHNEYEQSAANMRAYIRSMRKDASLTLPSGTSETTIGVPGSLMTLEEEVEKLQAEIRGAEAAQQAQSTGMQKQLVGLAAIPLDDPFLFIARDNLNRALNLLKTLREADQLSDDNPKVVTAREKVRIAQEDLNRQEEGFRAGLTTDRVIAETKLESLRARRDTILNSIHKAESRLPARRERSLEMIELQKDQEIKLAALKVTEEESAKLRLSNVSALSRLSPVDEAIIPENGLPRLAQVALAGIAAVILLFFPAVGWDYMRLARQQHTVAVIHTAPSTVTPAEEAETQPRNGKNSS